jgi:hypothetical protein
MWRCVQHKEKYTTVFARLETRVSWNPVTPGVWPWALTFQSGVLLMARNPQTNNCE